MLHNSHYCFFVWVKTCPQQHFGLASWSLHFSLSLYLLKTLASAPWISKQALIIQRNVLSDMTMGEFKKERETNLPKYSTTPLNYSCNDEREKETTVKCYVIVHFNWQLNTVFQQCQHNHLQLRKKKAKTTS